MSFTIHYRKIGFFAALLMMFISVVYPVGALVQPEKELSDYLLEFNKPAAKNLTEECLFRVSDNETKLFALTDASLSTTWDSARDAYIQIEAPEDIGFVYIEWSRPPENWILMTPGKGEFIERGEYGRNGFINEYISIDIPASRMRIQWEQQASPVSVARITVFSPGKIPASIQRWEPPCEKADMLLVSTHADDEHLYFGGALPVYAGERNKKVQVAYFVNHGLLRTRELLAGLWVVGVVNYPVLSNFPDQYVNSYEAAKNFYGFDPSLEYKVMLLRRFKPDVVLGHDLEGEYGHGAHMLSARTIVSALDAAQDSESFPLSAQQYGVWEVKKCYLHLYEKNEIIMDWTLPLARFGGKSGWEMAKEGYQFHVSQHHFKLRVRIEGPNDSRKFGLYRSTVGPDILKNDFFENIASSVPVPEPTSVPTTVPETASSHDNSASHEQNSSGSISDNRENDIYFISGAIGIIVIAALFMIVTVYPKKRRKYGMKRRSGRR